MILSLEHICKNFGGLSALSAVTFNVNKGEILGVIGPNGAGKTTLFNLITGVFSPSSGEIKFNGQSIIGLRPHKVAEAGISRTFQNIRLFGHMTALENVMVGGPLPDSGRFMARLVADEIRNRSEEQVIREKAFALLEVVGLGDEKNILAEALSYGKQRRLEIARALGAEPDLLLLDEPTAGMNESETDRHCDC